MLKDVLLPRKGEMRFLLFSGKGGVGKTTISASTAVWIAEQGYKTLIISTDLQLSLNDVFKQDITSAGTPIKGVKNLTAVSIDAAESMEKHRKKMLETLRVLEPESYLLKQMEIDKTVECGSAQAAVFELSEYLNSKDYEVIVFDNSPTGSHLEKIMAQGKYVLSMMNHIENRKKMIADVGEEEVNRQIKAIEEAMRLDQVAINNLRSDKTAFIMVMTPEALPLSELERNIPVLENEYQIPVRGIVINNVLSQTERVSTDFWKERWSMQNTHINRAYELFKNKEFGISQVLEEEVLGVDRLKVIGAKLYGGEK